MVRVTEVEWFWLVLSNYSNFITALAMVGSREYALWFVEEIFLWF